MEKSKGEDDADCRPDIWHVGLSRQSMAGRCRELSGGPRRRQGEGGKVEVLLLLLIWFE